jgi:hypothetical protein
MTTVGQQGESLIQYYSRRSFFQAMINTNHTAFQNDPIIREYLLSNGRAKWKHTKLEPITFQRLQKYGYIGAEYTPQSKFDVTTSILIANKSHSTHQKTPGNSYISYCHNSSKSKGYIMDIIKLPNSELQLLVVTSLIPLDDDDEHKNPYALLPDLLNASVLYDTPGEIHVIQCDQVIGQLVVIKNTIGTFGIDCPTVELKNLVSITLIGVLV